MTNNAGITNLRATGHGLRGLLASEHYQELPLGPLDPNRVEAVWRYESPQPCSQLVLPDGRMDLVAHATRASDGALQAVWLAIAGPADGWSRVPMRAGMLSVGVRFHIGWGGVCLGLSPAAMRNQVVVGAPVLACLGPLAQGMLNARTPVALQQALIDAVLALLARAKPGAAHARALRAIGQVMAGAGPGIGTDSGGGGGGGGGSDAPASADGPHSAGASARALRRDVQAAVGLSLRSLSGVLRFQRAVALLNARAASSLADLASSAGYADQAHMTREFRRFGGFTPALPQPVPVLGAAPTGWPNPSIPPHGPWPYSMASNEPPCHAHSAPFCDARPNGLP